MDPVVQAALIGGGSAVLGALLGGFVSFRISALQQRREARVDFRQRQLTELYGPMYLERRRSEMLRSRLPSWIEEEGGIRWRLVDNIARVKEDPALKPIVLAILESGDRVVKLLRDFGGLLEPFPLHAAFTKFVLHHEMLRMSWDAGEDQDPDERFPFPGGPPDGTDEVRCTAESAQDDLDCAIWLGMQSIQNDLEKLLGQPNTEERSSFLAVMMRLQAIALGLLGAVLVIWPFFGDSFLGWEELDPTWLRASGLGFLILAWIEWRVVGNLDKQLELLRPFLVLPVLLVAALLIEEATNVYEGSRAFLWVYVVVSLVLVGGLLWGRFGQVARPWTRPGEDGS